MSEAAEGDASTTAWPPGADLGDFGNVAGGSRFGALVVRLLHHQLYIWGPPSSERGRYCMHQDPLLD